MIRRWSYLNNVNNIFFDQFSKLNFVYYEQSFKTNIVFRKNISPLSTISRKAWSRRKHLTNWLIYQNVLTDWSREYIFFKKYNRFTLLFQMFSNSYLTYNSFLLKKLNVSSTVGSEKMLFSFLTSKLIQYSSRYSPSFYSFLKNYKNMTWLYVTGPSNVATVPSLNSPFTTPIFHTFQKTFSVMTINNKMNVWLEMIYNILFKTSILKLTSLYQTIIILQILSLKS